MNQSDQYKDGGSEGQYTRQYEAQDEPEGKAEDTDTPCNKTIITASDNCVCGLPKSQHKAQAAPAQDVSFTLQMTMAELAVTRAACEALAQACQRAITDLELAHGGRDTLTLRGLRKAIAQSEAIGVRAAFQEEVKAP